MEIVIVRRDVFDIFVKRIRITMMMARGLSSIKNDVRQLIITAVGKMIIYMKLTHAKC